MHDQCTCCAVQCNAVRTSIGTTCYECMAAENRPRSPSGTVAGREGGCELRGLLFFIRGPTYLCLRGMDPEHYLDPSIVTNPQILAVVTIQASQ